MNLPESPNDMPPDRHNDERWLRNLIVSLNDHSFVSLEWERDDHLTAETGETHGEWNVLIDTGRHQLRTKHPEITNALWYVTELANAHLEAVYDERVKARAAALAKLTTEERRLLGISV